MKKIYAILLAISLHQLALGAGITIITHGNAGIVLNNNGDTNFVNEQILSSGSVPTWLEYMGNQIITKAGGSSKVSKFVVEVIKSGGNYQIGSVDITGPSLWSSSHNGEIVMIVNWTSLADPFHSNQRVIDVLSDYLLTTVINGNSIIKGPIHLIGHSRGGSLVCGLAEALGESGVWVDQVTTVDPHPIQTPIPDDAPVKTYQNVLFADNYRQIAESPEGNVVPGAYERWLPLLQGGYDGLWANHSDVHLWYHGTIDNVGSAYDGEEPLTTTMRNSWYNSYENGGKKAGFHYSRIFEGNRMSHDKPVFSGDKIIDGYHDCHGGQGIRYDVDFSSAFWPNLCKIEVLRDGTVQGPGNHGVTAGETLYVRYRGKDYNSSCTVKLYTDTDRNPYNGFSSSFQTTSHSSSGSPYSYFESTKSWYTSSMSVGDSCYVLAVVNDGSRTRYLYAQPHFTFQDSGAIPPQITMTEPSSTITVDDGVTIRWMDMDADSDASISLWEDSNNSGYNGSQLVGGLSEDHLGFNGYYHVSTAGMPEGKEFYVYAKIDDGHTAVYSDNYTAKIIVDHPTEAPDAFSFDKTWEEDEGDGDGVIEAGENAEIDIQFRNNTGGEVTRVEAWLTTPNGNVEITDDYEDYWTMSSGETKWGDFEASLNFTATTQVDFNLYITFEKNGNPFYQYYSFSREFPQQGTVGPNFEMDHVIVNDTLENNQRNNNDGILQSGESIDFDLYLKNIGNADAVEVYAKVTDVKGNGTTFDVHDGWEDFPDLSAGGSAQKQNGSDFQNIRIPTSFEGPIIADITVKYGDSEITQFLGDIQLFNVQPEAWLRVYPEEHYFGVIGTDEDVMKNVEIRNNGTLAMTVSAITPSAGDTTWSGDPLPWTLQSGESKTIDITIETSALDGQAISREVIVTASGRVNDPGEEDRIIIQGLVSDSVPVSIITNAPGSRQPDVSGDWIVYQNGRNGNSDIFAYQISTGNEIQITTNSANQYSPRISGNLIVWKDYRDDPVEQDYADLYGYDLNNRSMGEFTVSVGTEMKRLIGVDGNLVAFLRSYFIFDPDGERSNWDELWDLIVYEYQGDSTFIGRVDTDYPPKSGHNPCASFSTTADFGGGMLVVGKHEVYWRSEYEYWDSNDQHVEIIDFANGENTLRSCGVDRWDDPYAPTMHRFAYRKDYEDPQGNDGEQVWLWDDGTIRRLTEPGTEDVEHANDNLAMGSGFIVYDKDQSVDRNKLFYWDLNANQAEYPEFLLTDKGGLSPEDARMDGNTVVWEGRDPSNSQWYIYYAILGSDIAVSEPGIQLTPDSPMDNETFNVQVTVRNISRYSTTEDVLVRLYDGDPDASGILISTTQTISGGIASKGQSDVTFTGISLPEGTQTVYAVCSGLVSENLANNKAFKTVVIGDSDTHPPIISNPAISEHSGDGDGYIENDEEVMISWSLTDASAIGSVTCTINSVACSVSGTYQVIAGPYAIGIHNVEISASDADDSPEYMDPWASTFEVHSHAPEVVSVSPANGDTGVVRYATVYANFERELLPASVTNGTFVLESGKVVTGNITYESSLKRVSFQPYCLLDFDTVYTGRFLSGSSSVKDMIGNAMETDYIWTFTTEPDTELPTAKITSPVDVGYGASNVTVNGTAYDESFQSYILDYSAGLNLTVLGLPVWIEICTGTNNVPLGALGQWDMSTLGDGVYTLRLRVWDGAGHVATNSVEVTIDRSALPFIVSSDSSYAPYDGHFKTKSGGDAPNGLRVQRLISGLDGANKYAPPTTNTPTAEAMEGDTINGLYISDDCQEYCVRTTWMGDDDAQTHADDAGHVGFVTACISSSNITRHGWLRAFSAQSISNSAYYADTQKTNTLLNVSATTYYQWENLNQYITNINPAYIIQFDVAPTADANYVEGSLFASSNGNDNQLENKYLLIEYRFEGDSQWTDLDTQLTNNGNFGEYIDAIDYPTNIYLRARAKDEYTPRLGLPVSEEHFVADIIPEPVTSVLFLIAVMLLKRRSFSIRN